jgi:hypothetical protein
MRNQYIDNFMHWAVPSIVASAPPLPLAWMKGHTGMGKTSIAQTCVEKLSVLSTPFATFFFFYQDQNNPQCFFPTIAYQIATQFPDYHDLLNEKIQRDSMIVHKVMQTQFWELIVLPLQELMKRGKGIE